MSTGKYKDYHTNSLIFIIAAAIYLITPVDFVPDMFPLGLMDDLMIISWILNVTSDELERYRLANKTDKNLSDSDKI